VSFEALGFVTGHILVKGCELSPTQRLTLISLASVADAHGESSHPGIGYLAETTGASDRTVQRSLEALVAAGLIEDTGERRGRTGRVVVWRMLLPEGTAKAAWPKHIQWRQPAEGEAAVNADMVSGLNDDTVSGFGGPNDDIDDTQSRHLRQPVPLIGNQSGNQKTDSSLRSESGGEVVCDHDGCSKTWGHPGPHQNPWWDTLVGLFGYEPDEPEDSLWGRIAAKARKAPPEEILRRAETYIATWPDVSLTPAALLKHWDWLGSQLAATTEDTRREWAERRSRAERRARLEAVDQLQRLPKEAS
jgi:DNA-binding MarR family transcriptional regulator